MMRECDFIGANLILCYVFGYMHQLPRARPRRGRQRVYYVAQIVEPEPSDSPATATHSGQRAGRRKLFRRPLRGVEDQILRIARRERG
jgi:hypothetical protein